jgi:uncharacterized protein (DUF1330 family)
MAAYVIGFVSNVKDPAGFAEYQKLAIPTLEKYGGKVIVGGNKIEVADGNWAPAGAIVVQFESLQKAKQWYNSREYHPLVARRKAAAATTGVIFLDGG